MSKPVHALGRNIRHCRNCGAACAYGLPTDGDDKARAICSNAACGTVHYENPLNVVGTVCTLGAGRSAKVLLCKRNIEPRKGLWTLPAGFMELGETLAQGAARETREEAGAAFDLGGLFTLISVPSAGQVHAFFSAQLHHATFAPGEETQEAKLFCADEIPWNEIAFTTVKETLKRWVDGLALDGAPSNMGTAPFVFDV